LDHAYFRLTDLEESALIDLYTDPLFFKTVVPRRDEAAIEAIRSSQQRHWEAKLARDQVGVGAEGIEDFEPWLVWQQETPLETGTLETGTLETGTSGSATQEEDDQTAQAIKISGWSIVRSLRPWPDTITESTSSFSGRSARGTW
jgi:hypothetical protein